MGRTLAFLVLAWPMVAIVAHADSPRATVYSPVAGVLCDRYICADEKGISRELIERYLGKKAAGKAFSQGDFDRTKFTFANGIFCDVKERLCRKDRYYDAKGQRSAVSEKYTRLLFGG
jgi:hypothetical protein